MCKYRFLAILYIFYYFGGKRMRITIDTDKGIFIVPKTFRETLKKQNEILKKAQIH